MLILLFCLTIFIRGSRVIYRNNTMHDFKALCNPNYGNVNLDMKLEKLIVFVRNGERSPNKGSNKEWKKRSCIKCTKTKCEMVSCKKGMLTIKGYNQGHNLATFIKTNYYPKFEKLKDQTFFSNKSKKNENRLLGDSLSSHMKDSHKDDSKIHTGNDYDPDGILKSLKLIDNSHNNASSNLINDVSGVQSLILSKRSAQNEVLRDKRSGSGHSGPYGAFYNALSFPDEGRPFSAELRPMFNSNKEDNINQSRAPDIMNMNANASQMEIAKNIEESKSELSTKNKPKNSISSYIKNDEKMIDSLNSLSLFNKHNKPSIKGYFYNDDRSYVFLNSILETLDYSKLKTTTINSLLCPDECEDLRNHLFKEKGELDVYKSEEFDAIMTSLCTDVPIDCEKYECDLEKMLSVLTDKYLDAEDNWAKLRENFLAVSVDFTNVSKFLLNALGNDTDISIVSVGNHEILSLLAGLNTKNEKQVSYGSAIFIELWKNKKNENYYSVVYNGERMGIGLFKEKFLKEEEFEKYLKMFVKQEKEIKDTCRIKGKGATEEVLQLKEKRLREKFEPLLEKLRTKRVLNKE